MSAHLALTVGLLAWTLLAREAAAQTAAASGRISGHVGSIGAGSIADATVTLTRIEPSVPAPLIVTSDRQGAFSFEGLAPGRYRVSASKAGYTSRQPLDASADRFDTGRDVTLPDREHAPHIALTLYRESSIAGRIAEPDGIPAPDVQIFAAVRRGATYVRLEDTRTVAAWDGRYHIAGLPPGDYLVVILPSVSTDPNRMRANAERRAPESSSATRPFFEPTFYPGVTSLASAETVTVFEGVPVDGIDTWLIPGERHSISGRIVWPENTTAENIVIEYANLTAGRSGLWTVPEPGDLFRITGVPRGTVVLLARADSNRGPLAGAVTTEINVDEVDDLELRLGAPGVVDGRVVYDSTVPAASRATSILLKQRLLPVSPLYPTPENAIGADGRFQITGALGVYDFDVPGLRIVRVTQHGREIPNGRIRLGPSESITGLEVLVGR
jgi:carboxypeptidase family protein